MCLHFINEKELITIELILDSLPLLISAQQHHTNLKYQDFISWAVVAHAFNLSTWEAEAGGFLSSRPAWSTEWVPGQPGIYRETLSWKTNKQTNKQTKKPFNENQGNKSFSGWTDLLLMFLQEVRHYKDYKFVFEPNG